MPRAAGPTAGGTAPPQRGGEVHDGLAALLHQASPQLTASGVVLTGRVRGHKLQPVLQDVNVSHLSQHRPRPAEVVAHVPRPDRIEDGGERLEVRSQATCRHSGLVDILGLRLGWLHPEKDIVGQDAVQ